MLTVKYFDREAKAAKTLLIPTDVLGVLVPEQEGIPPLEVTVNTDVVRIDTQSGERVAIYEFSEVVADAGLLPAGDEPEGHVKVEYDLQFTGGEYAGVGQMAYIPLSVIGEAEDMDGDERLKWAFEKVTGHNPVHIIHYTYDEIYDAEGNLFDSH